MLAAEHAKKGTKLAEAARMRADAEELKRKGAQEAARTPEMALGRTPESPGWDPPIITVWEGP